MNYYLFIDRERYPSDFFGKTALQEPWIVARSYTEVRHHILNFGFPRKISLGYNCKFSLKEIIRIVRFLCIVDSDDKYKVSHYSFNENFQFIVHSYMNNIKTEIISNYLDKYLSRKHNYTMKKTKDNNVSLDFSS
jgi:hypothetical protein